MLFSRCVLAIALFALLPLSPVVADVYKWVDAKGNVHFGDHLPERYKESGKSVEVSGRRPSEAEREAAAALADRARRAADRTHEQRLRDEAFRESSTRSDSPSNAGKVSKSQAPIKPKPGQARLTREQRMANYRAEMARYRESLRCFGKYQMKGGGTRGYAFNECESVKQPRHPDVR